MKLLKTLQTFFEFLIKGGLLFSILLYSANIFAQPTITGFNPASGPINTVVTINCTQFNATAARNIVFFGAVKAAVIAATSTAIKVKVPAGASFEFISVTAKNLTAYSSKPFVVTFKGNKEGFTAHSFAAKIDSATGSQPSWVTTSDINGDGKPDLVVANSGSNTISVFKNKT